MMKRERIVIGCFAIVTFLLFLWLQKQVFFSSDVSYLLHATHQILQGGHYATDIFETNPPMILYLYSPIMFLTNIIPMHVQVATKIYMFFLIGLSSAVCFHLLKRIMGNTKDYSLSLFFCGILFVYLIFSIILFAQREHFLLIFMMPYLLCAALRLENKPVNAWLALGVGWFAGLGFALKPYFLPALCFVELLFIFERRKLFAWIRIESISIAGVLILYLVSIFIFQRGYLTDVLPLVSKYYFFVVKQPWKYVLSMPYVIFCLLVAMLFPFYRTYDKYRHLSSVMYVALLGMIMAFIIPQNIWFYHTYPAFSLAFLLVIHCFAQHMHSVAERSIRSVYITIIMLMILYIPLSTGYLVYNYHRNFKQTKSTQKISLLFNSGNHTINCFTATGTSECFPMVSEIHNGQYQGRFPFFWWYQGLSIVLKNAKNKNDLKRVEEDRKKLVDAVAEDLNHYKTKWIIVNMKNFEHREGPGFNILTFLSQNENFKTAWRHYVFFTTLDDSDIYVRRS